MADVHHVSGALWRFRLVYHGSKKPRPPRCFLLDISEVRLPVTNENVKGYTRTSC